MKKLDICTSKLECFASQRPYIPFGPGVDLKRDIWLKSSERFTRRTFGTGDNANPPGIRDPDGLERHAENASGIRMRLTKGEDVTLPAPQCCTDSSRPSYRFTYDDVSSRVTIRQVTSWCLVTVCLYTPFIPLFENGENPGGDVFDSAHLLEQ